MNKLLIVAIALAGCDGFSVENPFEQHCDNEGAPRYPAIGGCIQGAAQGSPGGTCNVGEFGSGDYCDNGLECIYGTCYECGKVGFPCCGDSAQADSGGTCTSGGCAMSTEADGWYTCQGGVNAPAGDCSTGNPLWYVTYLSADCATETSTSFCAADQGAADAFVAANFGTVVHGPVDQNSSLTGPSTINECGQGPNCISGGGDGSLASGFWYFPGNPNVTAELSQCETNREPVAECTSWLPADISTNMCPVAAP